jgi:BlaI family penicillinase repressor
MRPRAEGLGPLVAAFLRPGRLALRVNLIRQETESAMAAREYELGAAELEVLRVLWDQGESNVRDVLHTLHQHGRRIAYTTAQTMLARLEQKGFVISDRSEAAFRYRAAITRDQISRSRLRELLEQLYDGAAGQLVLQLVRTQRLKREELAELQRLIERLDGPQGGGRAGR